ncbi:MAG TPA: hypothetical protein VL358_10770 [Caulobacteraceae bacterium]|nr:hypothetical protein [Caulobacteraceae bacterium]
MTNHRTFGLVMLILGGALLAFEATGSLVSAPLILIFGTLGGIGAVILGIWALLGKF